MTMPTKLAMLLTTATLAAAVLLTAGPVLPAAASSSSCAVATTNGITIVTCPKGIPIPSQYLPSQPTQPNAVTHVRSSTAVDPYILWYCGFGITCYALGSEGYGLQTNTWILEDQYGNIYPEGASAFCSNPSGCSFVSSDDPGPSRQALELFAMNPGGLAYSQCWCFELFYGHCEIFN